MLCVFSGPLAIPELRIIGWCFVVVVVVVVIIVLLFCLIIEISFLILKFIVT